MELTVHGSLLLGLAGVIAGLGLCLARQFVSAGLVAAVIGLVTLELLPARTVPAWCEPSAAPGFIGERLEACGLWARAEVATHLLPFVLPSLALCLAAVLGALLRRRGVWAVLLVIPAATPVVLLVSWRASAAEVMRPEDPRWSLVDVHRWAQRGADPADVNACSSLFRHASTLTQAGVGAELRRSLELCKPLCRTQVGAHRCDEEES